MTQTISVESLDCLPTGGHLWPTDALPFIASVGYIRAEFPSRCWYFPSVARNVTESLSEFFVGLLPTPSKVEQVYWSSEDDVLKVWTVIPEPDFSVEDPIYQAEMLFMEKFPEYVTDFSTIYRFNKPMAEIAPQGAHRVL